MDDDGQYMTKLTDRDKHIIKVMKRTGHPLEEIAATTGVSVRTVSRIVKLQREEPQKAVSGRVPHAMIMTSFDVMEQMSVKYAEAELTLEYYRAMSEIEPENPHWRNLELSYMQLQKGLLQDMAKFRRDNEWDTARLQEPEYQYDRTDFDTSLELMKGYAEGVELEIPVDEDEGLESWVTPDGKKFVKDDSGIYIVTKNRGRPPGAPGRLQGSR